ncbi:MAG: hypothetical protein BYD32DRAFT_467281 [Podila humilis]|nr:MAG: hypothetical protein BYD32DRAFT_467281 [Podila humilis]
MDIQMEGDLLWTMDQMCLWFRADSTCPYSTLTQNLWECCPVLTTLRDIESFNHSQTGNMLCAGGIESLVQSSHFLMHLDMPVEHLTREICNTLQDRHSTSLRTVRFYLQSADEEDFMRQLYPVWLLQPHILFLELQQQRWQQLKLQTLELTGISPTCYFDDDVDDDDDDDSYESLTEIKERPQWKRPG